MKARSLIFFILLLGFQVQSQTSKKTEEVPYYHIGKHGGRNLYIKSLFTLKRNIVPLYELSADRIRESGKIEAREKVIQELFCYDEHFYAITSSLDGENFYLTTFDNSMTENESIPVLSLSKSQVRGLKSGDYRLKFHHKKDRAAIILVEHDIVVCSINFSSLKSSTFTIKGGINFNYYSDIYLEDDLDLYLSRRAGLFHFKNGELTELQLDQPQLQGDLDEFVFIENDSEPYLFSMVYKGGLSGFAYCLLENTGSEPFRLKECALNRQRTRSKKEVSTFYNSIVKAEIIDGKIICTMQRIEQAINESILISCIDIEKQDNCWNFEVMSIHDAPYIWEENENPLNRSSFSFVRGNKLVFLFNAASKKMKPGQFRETDKRVITYDYSIQTTIMKSEIDLDSGDDTTAPIHENFQEETFKLFTSSFHLTAENELIFLTYKLTDKKSYQNYDQMLSGQTKVEIIKF